MIVFDAEPLRKPYMGFYTFVSKLGEALAQEARNRGVKMGFYVPEDKVGVFGDDMEYFIFHKGDKTGLVFPENVTLFHSSRQRSHYVPRKSDSLKVLTTVHDLNYLYSKEWWKHLKYHFFYQRSLNKADRLVAISEFAKNDTIAHLNLKGKKIDVIYNGVCEQETPSKPEFIPRHKYLYSVATVLPKKNFHVLPCLLVGNDYDLVLSGKNDRKSYIKKIMKEAEKYGVQDRIFIPGPCSESEKTWYIQNCEAFLFPSISEGFGMPPMEAMLFGKPVFLSNHTCLPEIAGQSAWYFDHDFNREKMQEEFRKGMLEYTRANENGADPDNPKNKAGIIARAKSFDWADAAKQYFDIYSEITGGNLR